MGLMKMLHNRGREKAILKSASTLLAKPGMEGIGFSLLVTLLAEPRHATLKGVDTFQ